MSRGLNAGNVYSSLDVLSNAGRTERETELEDRLARFGAVQTVNLKHIIDHYERGLSGVKRLSVSIRMRKNGQRNALGAADFEDSRILREQHQGRTIPIGGHIG